MTTDPRDYANLLRRLKMRASQFDCKEAADTIEDLRQRLEAAERDWTDLRDRYDATVIELTEARAGQTATWMAGRDASADMPFPEGWRDLGGGMNLKQQGYWAAVFNSCRNMIDALDPPTDLSTALTKHDQRVRDAALEDAAALVDANMLCGDSDGIEVLMPRTNPGNALGAAYAAAIRALKKGG